MEETCAISGLTRILGTDLVKVGQVIGYVGIKDWTTGPHFHFMTIVSGHAADPMTYLP